MIKLHQKLTTGNWKEIYTQILYRALRIPAEF